MDRPNGITKPKQQDPINQSTTLTCDLVQCCRSVRRASGWLSSDHTILRNSLRSKAFNSVERGFPGRQNARREMQRWSRRCCHVHIKFQNRTRIQPTEAPFIFSQSANKQKFSPILQTIKCSFSSSSQKKSARTLEQWAVLVSLWPKVGPLFWACCWRQSLFGVRHRHLSFNGGQITIQNKIVNKMDL